MGRLPSEVERGSKMAVRYSMTDAFNVLLENNDQEAMDDIFRRYGGVARKMLRAICSSNDPETIKEVIELVPEYVSMQKVNKIHRELLEGADPDDEEVEEEEEHKAKPAPKARRQAAKAKAKPEPVEEVDDDEDEDEEAGPYDGKNARELFELCKERGIKTQPRKRATTYKKLLEDWDAKHAGEPDVEEEEDDDEDWDI